MIYIYIYIYLSRNQAYRLDTQDVCAAAWCYLSLFISASNTFFPSLTLIPSPSFLLYQWGKGKITQHIY